MPTEWATTRPLHPLREVAQRSEFESGPVTLRDHLLIAAALAVLAGVGSIVVASLRPAFAAAVVTAGLLAGTALHDRAPAGLVAWIRTSLLVVGAVALVVADATGAPVWAVTALGLHLMGASVALATTRTSTLWGAAGFAATAAYVGLLAFVAYGSAVGTFLDAAEVPGWLNRTLAALVLLGVLGTGAVVVAADRPPPWTAWGGLIALGLGVGTVALGNHLGWALGAVGLLIGLGAGSLVTMRDT